MHPAPRRFLLLVSLLLGTRCTPRSAVDAGGGRAQLLALDAAFSRASVETSTSDAFAAYLAEDAVELQAGQPPRRGRPSIVLDLRDEPGSPRSVLRWTPEEGSASGDLGYTWGRYELSLPAKGSRDARVLKGRYMSVWRREAGGAWKVIVDMGSPDPR